MAIQGTRLSNVRFNILMSVTMIGVMLLLMMIENDGIFQKFPAEDLPLTKRILHHLLTAIITRLGLVITRIIWIALKKKTMTQESLVLLTSLH